MTKEEIQKWVDDFVYYDGIKLSDIPTKQQIIDFVIKDGWKERDIVYLKQLL